MQSLMDVCSHLGNVLHREFMFSLCFCFLFFQRRHWCHIVNPASHPQVVTVLQELHLLKDQLDPEKVKSCEEVTNAMPVTFQMQAMWDQTIKDSLLVNYVSAFVVTIQTVKRHKNLINSFSDTGLNSREEEAHSDSQI